MKHNPIYPSKRSLAGSCLLWLLVLLPLQAADEIVINMQGPADKQAALQALSIWDKDTASLQRALHGKTREQALYAIPHVSAKDKIISGKKKSYALVEYTQEPAFCKLLFTAKDPQTFLAAATTAQDVLAINKKYGTLITLSEQTFEKAYAGQFTPLKTDISLPAYTVLYELTYTASDTPQPQTLWLVFEKKQLTHIFYTEQEKDHYLQAFSTVAASPVKQKTSQKKSTVRKALVCGGTAQDQAYMPRVVNPKTNLTPACLPVTGNN